VDNKVSVRQRLEELKSYVYDELNLLKMQISKTNSDSSWNGDQKASNPNIKNEKAISDIAANLQNRYKRRRHMRSYSRVEKRSGRKYRRV